MRRKQSQFIGYRTDNGETVECKEGDIEGVRKKLNGYKGKLTPRYVRLQRR